MKMKYQRAGNGEFGMKIKDSRILCENESLREVMECLIVLFQATDSQRFITWEFRVENNKSGFKIIFLKREY